MEVKVWSCRRSNMSSVGAASNCGRINDNRYELKIRNEYMGSVSHWATYGLVNKYVEKEGVL